MSDTASNEQPINYVVHLVRLWRSSPTSPWRASAQSVTTGEVVHFETLASLYGYLHACTCQADDAAGHPPQVAE